MRPGFRLGLIGLMALGAVALAMSARLRAAGVGAGIADRVLGQVDFTKNAPNFVDAIGMTAPAGVPVDLYAEGSTPDWALPLPEPDGPENGAARRFTFDLDGLPAGAEAKGATLILTAVSGDDAIEVPVHLD